MCVALRSRISFRFRHLAQLAVHKMIISIVVIQPPWYRRGYCCFLLPGAEVNLATEGQMENMAFT